MNKWIHDALKAYCLTQLTEVISCPSLGSISEWHEELCEVNVEMGTDVPEISFSVYGVKKLILKKHVPKYRVGNKHSWCFAIW